MDDKPRKCSSGSAQEFADHPPSDYRKRSSSQAADEIANDALNSVEYPLSVKEKADSNSDWEMVEEQNTESPEKDTTYKANPASIESEEFSNQQSSSSTFHFVKSSNDAIRYGESSCARNTTVETKMSDTLNLFPDQKQVELKERPPVAKFGFEEETPIFNQDHQRNADLHISQRLRREGFQKRMKASHVEGQVHVEGFNSNKEYKNMHCYGILRGHILNFYNVGEQKSRPPIDSIEFTRGFYVSPPLQPDRPLYFVLLREPLKLKLEFNSQAEMSKWRNEIKNAVLMAPAISRLYKDKSRRSDSPPVELDSRQLTTTLPENKTAESVLTEKEQDRKKLLNWCRKKVSNIDNLEVDNFTSSWVDGRVLSAIIHSIRPELVDPDSLTRKGDFESINFTLDMFEQLTGEKIDARVQQILGCNEEKIIKLAKTLKWRAHYIFGEKLDDAVDEQVEQALNQCPPAFERNSLGEI